MFLLQISRVFLLTCNGLMFCEVNAEELTGMQCLFLLFPMETYFLWTIIRRCYLLLSLLVVCLSHCLLSFLQNSILGLFFLGDPSSCPCFKPQREEISKAKCGIDVCSHHIFSCAALLCPSLISPAGRNASWTWACTYQFTLSAFFPYFFSLNGLHNIKYNDVESFLILNSGMLPFISLHL